MFGVLRIAVTTSVVLAAGLIAAPSAEAGVGYFYAAPSYYYGPPVYYGPAYGVGLPYTGPAYGYAPYVSGYYPSYGYSAYRYGYPSYGYRYRSGFRPSKFSGGFGLNFSRW